jgi:uridine phosphorylase
VPERLRPTAPIAAEAVLVGDPGRALLLAQELLRKPKMSNHARGLWGYTGPDRSGRELTIQATGIGGPSAALVLADLAKLGVRRAVRVGSCMAAAAGSAPGDLVLVEEAMAEGGSASSFGVAPGGIVQPDPELTRSLREALGDSAKPAAVASFDSTPDAGRLGPEVGAADMQTVAVLARARELGVAAAAVLFVADTPGAEPLGEEERNEAERRAGRAAATALSASS